MSFQSDPKASPGDFFDVLERSGYRWHAKIDSLHAFLHSLSCVYQILIEILFPFEKF